MTGMLYGVSPIDPATWALAAALLVTVGVIATLVPAMRATRIDPLEAIRME
jgi:ABC-type antimicrobial peptide transport system permease subunit